MRKKGNAFFQSAGCVGVIIGCLGRVTWSKLLSLVEIETKATQMCNLYNSHGMTRTNEWDWANKDYWSLGVSF